MVVAWFGRPAGWALAVGGNPSIWCFEHRLCDAWIHQPHTAIKLGIVCCAVRALVEETHLVHRKVEGYLVVSHAASPLLIKSRCCDLHQPPQRQHLELMPLLRMARWHLPTGVGSTFPLAGLCLITIRCRCGAVGSGKSSGFTRRTFCVLPVLSGQGAFIKCACSSILFLTIHQERRRSASPRRCFRCGMG